MELEDKIRRRLKPFVVEGRILEPSIRTVSGTEDRFEIDIAPKTKAFEPANLERDLKAALSDLAQAVSFRLAASAS